MSWKSASRLFQTLSFRLVRSYTLAFTILTACAFAGQYYGVRLALNNLLDQELSSEVREWEDVYALGGIEAIEREFRAEADAFGADSTICRLYAADGSILASSPLETWQRIPSVPASLALHPTHQPLLQTIYFPERRIPLRVAYFRTAGGSIFQFSLPQDHIYAVLPHILRLSFIATVTMALIATLIGYWLAKRSLLGLHGLRDAARSIAGGDFTKVIHATGGGSEIDELCDTFNDMREHLQILVTDLQDVSNSIAHDLRTPLVRIRVAAETLLAKNAGSTDDELERIISECDHLAAMVDTMLAIAQADACRDTSRFAPVDLDALLQTAVELFTPLAEDRGITLTYDSTHQPLNVCADYRQLQRLASNLIDNALKFTPETGCVTVSIRNRGDYADIFVEDTGVGISEANLPNVCKKFFRADSSRSLAGNGLGLSYVEAVTKAHKGKLAINSVLNQGTKITVSLPMTTASQC